MAGRAASWGRRCPVFNRRWRGCRCRTGAHAEPPEGAFMSFVQPRKNAARSTAGIGVAVVLHIVLLWALMNGLGHKVMQVINPPIETKLIEEIKPPPPP